MCIVSYQNFDLFQSEINIDLNKIPKIEFIFITRYQPRSGDQQSPHSHSDGPREHRRGGGGVYRQGEGRGPRGHPHLHGGLQPRRGGGLLHCRHQQYDLVIRNLYK